MTDKIVAFWGCVINHRLPFIERITKLALDRLGVELQDLKGASCCPDTTYIRTLGEQAWLSVAASNLALAEDQGDVLLVSCNGCYNTLKSASLELQNPGLKKSINEVLAKVNLSYNERVKIIHIVDYLTNDLKSELIKTKVEKPLKGLRFATFLGCHATSPPKIAVDDAEQPRLLDELVDALGAEVVDYEDKGSCCGGPGISLNDPASQSLLKRKLKAINLSGADGIVVTCPTCFIQFDRIASQTFPDLQIPVFHYFELLALSLGVDVEGIPFEWHAVDVKPVISLFTKHTDMAIIDRNFEFECLDSTCKACTMDCTAAQATRSLGKAAFDPLKTVRSLEKGKLTEVLKSKDIWECLGCKLCEIWCPGNRGLEHMFSTLKSMAVKRGLSPEAVNQRVETFKKSGLGLPPIPSELRTDLELAPISKPSVKKIRRLLSKEESKT